MIGRIEEGQKVREDRLETLLCDSRDTLTRAFFLWKSALTSSLHLLFFSPFQFSSSRTIRRVHTAYTCPISFTPYQSRSKLSLDKMAAAAAPMLPLHPFRKISNIDQHPSIIDIYQMR